MVIDLSQSMAFQTRLLTKPNRIVIDTDPLDWPHKPSMSRPVGPIRDVGYDESGTSGHLTVKLAQPATIKSAFIMPPRENAGWRLVVDLEEATQQTFTAKASEPVQATEAEQAPAPLPPPAPPSRTAPAIIIASPNAEPPAQTPTPTQPLPVSRGGSVISAPMPPPAAPPSVAVAPPQQAEPPPEDTAKEAPIPLASSHHKSDGRPTIVIDPGHGGVDPGATGISGIYEKFITYAMARELQQQLEKTGRYHVRLTRDRDVFIRLRDRVAIARQHSADLFISLHADVVKDPDIRGLSVYTLSQNASDAEAQSLADKENKADLIAGIDLTHESSDVANILIDLAQRETMNRSAGFAGNIVEELGRETPLLTNTHRFAGFAVLKAPDVPAVLIEMGYLSNTIDEHNLRQPEYRHKLAHAISQAVDRYFLEGQKAHRP